MSMLADSDKMLEALSRLNEDELQELLTAHQQLENRLKEEGPKTDDELHEWLKFELHIDVPRVAVCEGHSSPFQFLADLYFERIEAALGVANRGGSKCVSGDTLIYDTESGRRISIREVVETDSLSSILTVDNAGRVVPTEIDYKWNTGENRVLAVKLKTGRVLRCTYEHPLMTSAGWRRADEIVAGEYVVLPARLPHPTRPASLPDAHVDALALLLSEGCYSQHMVTFSTDDERIVEIARRIADYSGVEVKYRSGYDYAFSRGIGNSRTRNPVRLMLDGYGIGHEKAAQKRIPEAVFTLGKDQLARFLTVFWMCDGFVTSKEAAIGLASRGMLEDIQHLLLRFGVQTRIRRSAENAWVMVVYNSCLDALADCLSLWGHKKGRLDELLKKQRNYNAGRPPLTPQIAANVADRFAGKTWHERREAAPQVRARLGWSRNMPAGPTALSHGGVKTLSRDRLEALCVEGGMGVAGFEHLLSDELWWDEVVAIDDAGVEETFDLTVNSTHCFIANDILSHNTFLVAVLHWLNSRFKPGCESCVAADTPVDCPRDHRRYPDGVPISQIKPGQLVWTFNEEIRRFELKPVIEVRMTRQGVPIFRLTLDSGHTIRVTADHRFMRRDGSWAELRELKPGDSLMPLYRDWEPYVRVNPEARRGGQMMPEYKAVADALWPERKGMHVDHVDERRENSGQDNLQVMTPAEHCSKTMRGRNFGLRKKKPKLTLSEAGRKGGSAKPLLMAHECSCGEIFYRPPGGRKGLCPQCKTEARACPICGEHFVVPRKSRRETCSRSCGQKMRYQKEAGVFNHKVVSIEPDGSEDVWDMEVDGNHNFVVHGVVLHNCTFGAIEAQSFRAYSHLKGWIFDERGDKKPEIVSSLMRETILQNGSRIEVLGSTPEAVNGPHPQKAHADEIELMRDDTWRESRNMTVSKRLADGRVIIPQDILTSTRKGPSGRVQMLIDEIEQAVAHGYQPPRSLYIWCIKETAAQVKNCRIARPDLPEPFKCPCNRIPKGEWEDGTPRTLDRICLGDFYKSRGWQPFGDIVKHFRENDRNTFEVQQLCAKPEMSFHYVPHWRDDRHLVRNFVPDPANGPIVQSVDWGGTNPHAVNWYQLLRNEVEAESWIQPESGPRRMVRIREGTLVCFDEIYIAEVGNEKLAKLVKEREFFWRTKFGLQWQVFERYADPQGRAARLDWKAEGLRTTWHTTREFDEHIKAIRSMFDDDLFRCAGDRCPKFVWEVKQWRADERTGRQLDINNHAMSNFRYAVANLKRVARSFSGDHRPRARSIARRAFRVRITRPAAAQAPVAFSNTKDRFAQWRKSLGGPITDELRRER